MIYKPFDIVVVPFPFTDKEASRRRPALIVSNEKFNETHNQYILTMITTAKHSQWPSDVVISDFKGANLSVPSIIRLKLFTLDSSIIIRKLGKLINDDIAKFQNTFQHCLF